MPPQLHSLYLWDIQIGNLHAGFCFSLDKRHTVSRCAVYRTFFSRLRRGQCQLPQRLQRKFFVVPSKVSVFLFYFPFFTHEVQSFLLCIPILFHISCSRGWDILQFFLLFFRLPRMEYFFLRSPCPYQARPAEAPDVCISPDRFRNTAAHSDRPPEFRRGNVRTALCF